MAAGGSAGRPRLSRPPLGGEGVLLATLVAVPALGANKAVLYGFLVLGLAALLEQTRGGPGEEAVLLLMAKM